jgi:hypothetical protein
VFDVEISATIIGHAEFACRTAPQVGQGDRFSREELETNGLARFLIVKFAENQQVSAAGIGGGDPLET